MTYINISLDYLTENSTEQEIKSFLNKKVNGDTILNTINEDSNEDVLHEMIEIIVKTFKSKTEGLQYLRNTLTKKTKMLPGITNAF